MTHPFTILFVEDDSGIRDTTAQLLEARGFRMLVASSGAEALRLLAENHVDVLFTDVVMPEMNGIDLAKRAKLLNPDLKIMFMTAYYSRGAEAAKLGTLLYKPLRETEMAFELEKLLEDG